MLKYFTSLSKILQRITSFIIIFIPALALIGWIFNNEILKRDFPGLIAVNPFSAILFIILGVLLFSHSITRIQFVQALKVFFCIAIIIYSFTIILRYVLNVDLHLDELLFQSKLGGNRMALTTAICFVLSSLIFIFLDFKSRSIRITSQVAAIFVFLLASHGILIDIYNFTGYSPFTFYVAMALKVSICFLVVSIGVLSLREDFEVRIFIRHLFYKSTIKQKIIVALSVSFIALILIGIISYTNIQFLNNSTNDLADKIQMITLRAQLIDELVSAESAVQGYILTGQGDYLVPYLNSIQKYPITLQNLVILTRNPRDIVLLHQIDDLAQLKLESLDMVMRERQTKGLDSAVKLVKTNAGKNYIDQIRDINEQMNTNDQHDLESLRNKNSIASQRTIITIIIGLLMGLITVSLGVIFIIKVRISTD